MGIESVCITETRNNRMLSGGHGTTPDGGVNVLVLADTNFPESAQTAQTEIYNKYTFM